MTQNEPLAYWATPSRFQKASWIMLLVMGIVSVLMGTCVSAAVALLFWSASDPRAIPRGINLQQVAIFGAIFCLVTFTAGSLYLSTSIFVKRGSRNGTRLAQITAICTSIMFVLFLVFDLVLYLRSPLFSRTLMIRAIASLGLRALVIAANATLAWLLTRRLAEMPHATPESSQPS